MGRGSSTAEIEKAYKVLIIRVHPDKNANLGEEEMKRANEKTMTLNRARDLLMDEKRRAAYDRYGVTGDAEGFGCGGGMYKGRGC